MRGILILGLTVLAALHSQSWFGSASTTAVLTGAALLIWWLATAAWIRTSPAVRAAGIVGGITAALVYGLFTAPFWTPHVLVEMQFREDIPAESVSCSWGTTIQQARVAEGEGAALSIRIPRPALFAVPTVRFLPPTFDFAVKRFPILEHLRIVTTEGAVIHEARGLEVQHSIAATDGTLREDGEGILLRPAVSDRPSLVAIQNGDKIAALDGRSSTLRLSHLLLYASAICFTMTALVASRLPKTWVPKLVLAGVSALIGLSAVEVVARMILPPADQYHVWEPGMRVKFRPVPGVMPGLEGEAMFSTSSKGIRGRETLESDEYRILAIGGSTTECLYHDQAKTWTGIMETQLSATGVSTWVGNVGHSGHTTREHVLQADRLLQQEPKIDAVVMLVGVNDFWLRLRKGDNYDPHALDNPAKLPPLLNRAFRVYPQLTPGQIGFDRLHLGRLWRSVNAVQVVKAEAKEKKLMVQGKAGKFLIRGRENYRKSDRLPALPDLESGLAEYRRNLNRIIDTIQRRGVRLVFATQPSLWSEDITDEERSYLLFGHGVGGVHTPENLVVGMEAYNDVLRDVAKTRGVECVELSRALPKDFTVFTDDVHFNESGAQKVAELLLKPFLNAAPYASDH